jgi:hypothetical protein
MSNCRQEECPYWPGEGCMKGVAPCGDGFSSDPGDWPDDEDLSRHYILEEIQPPPIMKAGVLTPEMLQHAFDKLREGGPIRPDQWVVLPRHERGSPG